MKHRPPVTNKYHRIYTIGLTIAVGVIVLGSIWAFVGLGDFKALASPFVNTFEFLTRSHLIVKIDHTRLPANGSAQTVITASYPRITSPVTAHITEGTGNITRTGDSTDPVAFTYTAGISIGHVVIAVTHGSITETVSLELVEPIIPTAPVITSPPTNSQTNLLRPEIIGTAPANSKVIISNNGQVNTTTTADGSGVFRIRLEKPLTNGQQNITAIAINDLDLTSPPSAPTIIQIDSEPVKYDIGNVRFSPNPIIVGQSFGLFIPASLNTEKVLVEFEGTTYELKDTNGASVFSRSLPAPQSAGTYPASIILVDAANTQTRFDNALQIPVKDK